MDILDMCLFHFLIGMEFKQVTKVNLILMTDSFSWF